MTSSRKKSARPSKKIRRRRLLRWVISIVVIILAVRLVLPYWVLSFVNNRLSELRGYFGHVNDIDLAIYRGAYVVKDFYINRIDTATQKQTPFFCVPHH